MSILYFQSTFSLESSSSENSEIGIIASDLALASQTMYDFNISTTFALMILFSINFLSLKS